MSAASAHPEHLLLALDEALDHEIQLRETFSQMKPIALDELQDAFETASLESLATPLPLLFSSLNERGKK
jgi:hypothetical protein